MPVLTMMTYAHHLEREGRAIAEAAAAGGLAAPVPACPGWTMTDLLNQVEQSCRGIAALVAGGVTQLDGTPSLPPPAGGDPVAGCLEEVATLADTLRATPAERPVWNWSVAGRTASCWARRMALDITVHCWDAQDAVGTAEPLDAELAADGVAEFFDVFLPTGLAMGTVTPTAATLRFEFADVADPLDRAEPVEPNLGLPVDGVTLIRGPASDLLLAVWHRRPFGNLLVSGDRTVPDGWQPVPS